MLNVALSEQEQAVLTSVLEEYLSELRMEIANTARANFRDGLKEKKRVLVGILNGVSAEAIGRSKTLSQAA